MHINIHYMLLESVKTGFLDRCHFFTKSLNEYKPWPILESKDISGIFQKKGQKWVKKC